MKRETPGTRRLTCRSLTALCALLSPVIFSAGAQAAPSTVVTVTVTVVAPPPCTINDDKPIEVNFGEVMTTRVDGENYRMPVNYSLSCSGATSNAMKLQIKGTGAAFDGNVLRTDKTGLGIALLRDGNKLPLNGWTNFSYPDKPALWAVPVKQSGVTLSGGEFTAGATLSVAYGDRRDASSPPLLLMGEKTLHADRGTQTNAGGMLSERYHRLALQGRLGDEAGNWLSSGLTYTRGRQRGMQAELQAQTRPGDNLSLSLTSRYRTDG
ncbi:fimbrial protein [Serratia marcescens]|uniref:fimbrial protein n=1 Tax=Serratia marcescens TaxID=615 RepID=UPI000CCE0E8D|nr:fimbrial protein [Serratia marcescens]PNU37053.1 hypothetical protein C2M05_02475 [Serratia marcescens]